MAEQSRHAAHERDRALVACFAAYMRRRLSDQVHNRVVVVEAGAPVSRDAEVAIVVGKPSRWWLRRTAKQTGLHRQFAGLVGSAPLATDGLRVTILDRWDRSVLAPTPPDYDVLAIVTTYNEADIIEQLLERLLTGGIRVHVIDNWSADGTAELLQARADAGIITFERFPLAGPSPYFELEPLLTQVEDVAERSGADWIIHHDADEIRESPWPGVSLRDGLWAVEQWGFNCIDHTIVNFRPVDESWHPGTRLEEGFQWFEFGEAPAHFIQLKAWKPQAERVLMAGSGGHLALFPQRRVFPYKFVTRHYPIRSQAHGERKILRERQERWSPSERARGWHTHYDHYGPASSFVWDPAVLSRWDEVDHHQLLQRLSGAGLPNNPEAAESLPPLEATG